MSIFDLVFLAAALATAGSLLVAAVTAWRGRMAASRRVLRRLALGAGTYLVVLVAVSLFTPGRVLAIGEDNCSDDWCIAVTAVSQPSGADDHSLVVTFRLTSRARRITQREHGVLVYVRDSGGHRIDAQPATGEAPFDVALGPGDEHETTRRFNLFPGTAPVEVVLTRAGLPFPGCLIIGDADSFLHARTVVRLR
jgi:hypothetical protein